MYEDIKLWEDVTFFDRNGFIHTGTVIGVHPWGYYVTVVGADPYAETFIIGRDKVVPVRTAAWALSLSDEDYRRLSHPSDAFDNRDFWLDKLDGMYVDKINGEFLRKSDTPSYETVSRFFRGTKLGLDGAYAAACRYPFLVRTDANGIGQPFYRDVILATRNDGGRFRMYESVATPASLDDVPSQPVGFPFAAVDAFGVRTVGDVVLPFCDDLRRSIVEHADERALDRVAMAFSRDDDGNGQIMVLFATINDKLLDSGRRVCAAHAMCNGGEAVYLPTGTPYLASDGFTFPLPAEADMR